MTQAPLFARDGWHGLPPGFTLPIGSALVSSNGQYRLTMQGDGNLVATGPGGGAYWASNTPGHPDMRLVMQGDGNLILLDSHNVPWWHSYGEANYALPQPGAALYVDDDGNMVVASLDGAPLWSVWQSNDDRGTSFGKWFTKATKTAAGAVASVARVLKALRPLIDATLAATGNAAVAGEIDPYIEAGSQLDQVDAQVQAIGDSIAPAAQDGFHAAVGLLTATANLTPQAIANVRAGLRTQADQQAFDYAISFAPTLSDDPAVIAAASASRSITASLGGQSLARAPTAAQTAAALGAFASGPKIAAVPKTVAGAALGLKLAPKPAAPAPGPTPPPTSPTDFVARAAAAAGLPIAQYIARVQAGTLAPPSYGDVTGHAPDGPGGARAPASSSSSGVVVAAGVGLVLLALFAAK